MAKIAFLLLLISIFYCCSGADAEDICSLELDAGPCLALFIRYGFDCNTNQCVEFVYGGCGGNANNFKTLEECESRCGQ